MPKEGGKTNKQTPMMRQYQRIRGSLPEDVLLFFRLGDFYEMFFEDAKEASGILNVALTKRNGIPMCGVPFHAAESYVAKLIKAGRRVAICDQIGEPTPGKIVEREVTQVISAGTVDNLNLLESNRSNYLAAVFEEKGAIGLAFLDHTTGEFRVAEFENRGALEDELARVAPSELLYSDEHEGDFDDLRASLPYDGYAFLFEHAEFALKEHFGVQSLDGFGCAGMRAAVSSAGAILHYLKTQLRREAGHIRRIQTCHAEDYVLIDKASQLNLELVESRSGRRNTLLHTIDRTCTPMGGRKLRDWLLHPLRDLDELRARQDLVARLLDESFLLSKLREALRDVRDVERTVSRLSQGSGNARDLLALSTSLQKVPDVKAHVSGLGEATGLAGWVGDRLHAFHGLVEKLGTALEDEPPTTIKDGKMIRGGFDETLDALNSAATEGRDWLARLQEREIERTGIKSLKVRYNAVFGYFIEVTKANLGRVPDDYTRKQTTANSERFITPELKEIENKILGADERARNREYELFIGLRESVLEELAAIQETADALAVVDVMQSFAETARLFNCCRPGLDASLDLRIEDGRHPVLDQTLVDEKFVPNATAMDGGENRLLLITGPNMAGKSTYIRQVALLAILAQTGSYIPAASAQVGLVDKIFTRVGASDDLSRGQSTFMVEMNETALIVNNATERSLVVLDEIGRGTSTFDGLSIAWSVAEHLHDTLKSRTLFATHYHEMTALAKSREGVKNYNVAVREWNDKIIFLRQIVPGTADKSYGIQVARLAGLPDGIIARAKDILHHLEANAQSPEKRKRKRKARDAENPDSPSPQLSLFE